MLDLNITIYFWVIFNFLSSFSSPNWRQYGFRAKHLFKAFSYKLRRSMWKPVKVKNIFQNYLSNLISGPWFLVIFIDIVFYLNQINKKNIINISFFYVQWYLIYWYIRRRIFFENSPLEMLWKLFFQKIVQNPQKNICGRICF